MTNREWAEAFCKNPSVEVLVRKLQEVEGAAAEAMRDTCIDLLLNQKADMLPPSLQKLCKDFSHGISIEVRAVSPESSSWLADHDRKTRQDEAAWWTAFVERYRDKLANSPVDFGEISKHLAALIGKEQP